MEAHEDQFQEEVLQVFAEEGLEWMGQIKTALEELDKGALPEHEFKLYDTVIRSLTNLMGSAAMVDLVALQKLTLAIIPLLQAIQHKTLTPTRAHVAAIRHGLALLASAIQVLGTAESKMVVVANLESIMQLQAEHIQRVVSRLDGAAPSVPDDAQGDAGPERTVPARVVVSALLDLKRARPSSLEPSRHFSECVLRRLHDTLEPGQTDIPVATVSGLIHVIADRDRHFLEDVQQRVAGVATALRELQSAAGHADSLQRNLQGALHDLAFLYERAIDVGAMEIAQFLHGLEILLLEVAYKGVVLNPQRLNGLSSRAEALISIARTWVERGRVEQAEIEQVLAPLLDVPRTQL